MRQPNMAPFNTYSLIGRVNHREVLKACVGLRWHRRSAISPQSICLSLSWTSAQDSLPASQPAVQPRAEGPGGGWFSLVLFGLRAGDVYWTRKPFVICFLWSSSHESIPVQMYKHRSTPVITPNKHTYTHTHTRMHKHTYTNRGAGVHLHTHKLAQKPQLYTNR